MKNRLAQNTDIATEETEISPGDIVFAKIASGQEVRRRVWSVEDAVVYICSERLYKDLLIGASRLWPIGFPRRDVRIANAAEAAKA